MKNNCDLRISETRGVYKQRKRRWNIELTEVGGKTVHSVSFQAYSLSPTPPLRFIVRFLFLAYRNEYAWMEWYIFKMLKPRFIETINQVPVLNLWKREVEPSWCSTALSAGRPVPTAARGSTREQGSSAARFAPKRVHQTRHTLQSLVSVSLFPKSEMVFLFFSNGQLNKESVPHFQQFGSQKNKVKKDIYSPNLK